MIDVVPHRLEAQQREVGSGGHRVGNALEVSMGRGGEVWQMLQACGEAGTCVAMLGHFVLGGTAYEGRAGFEEEGRA